MMFRTGVPLADIHRRFALGYDDAARAAKALEGAKGKKWVKLK